MKEKWPFIAVYHNKSYCDPYQMYHIYKFLPRNSLLVDVSTDLADSTQQHGDVASLIWPPAAQAFLIQTPFGRQEVPRADFEFWERCSKSFCSNPGVGLVSSFGITHPGQNLATI